MFNHRMVSGRQLPLLIILSLVTTVAVAFFVRYSTPPTPQWTPEQLAILQSLWIESLPIQPNDPTNAFSDDAAAAKLGQQLFFDTRLSANGQVSCATCHQPEYNFTDQRPVAVGISTGERNTQSIIGAAYSPWFFWDGRKDSLWSQALGPLENPIEHGSSRSDVAKLIADNKNYRHQYQQIFAQLPDTSTTDGQTQVFVNAGKAIAAYESLLLPRPSRFDNYVDYLLNETPYPAEQLLTETEVAGLALFIDQAQCINCHNGPLFSNFAFHNNGQLPPPGKTPDFGRAHATQDVLMDEFNCYSEFNDADNGNCSELDFIKRDDENIGAHKTPSLRNLEHTEPYMHAGQLADLMSVLQHYNRGEPALIGHNEAKPLNLSKRELKQLLAFLRSLQAPLAVDNHWLQNPTP